MDEIDRAQEREQLDRSLALAMHAWQGRATTPPDGCCVDCGALIEPARLRALGATDVCATCAAAREAFAASVGGARGG